MQKPAITHIKICGITNLEDALFAACAGAILSASSSTSAHRYVSPASVRGLCGPVRRWAEQPARNRRCPLVGVFVNEPPDSVARIMQYAGLDYAQLHGDETPDALARWQVAASRRSARSPRQTNGRNGSNLSLWPAASLLAARGCLSPPPHMAERAIWPTGH